MATRCKVEGCTQQLKVKKAGLCAKHYQRWWRHGDPLAWKRKAKSRCSVEGCELAIQARGMCQLHDRRQIRYGTTDLPERPIICVIEGCGRPVEALALCDRHYRRKRSGRDAERRCGFCGETISPLTQAWKFCSAECREREQFIQRQETHRDRWLKRYGLTVGEFDTLLEDQGGVCAICGSDDHSGRNWNVDHDHKTGQVRGVLCVNCNIGLGKFKDDTDLLRRAADYIDLVP